MKILSSALLCWLMLFCPVFAAEVIPGASQTGFYTVTNSGTTPIGVFLTAYDSDNTEVESSGPSYINAGASYTFTFNFPSGTTIAKFVAYRTAPSADKVGASFIYNAEATSGNVEIRTFTTANASPTEPFPVTRGTLYDYSLLSDGRKTVWQISDTTLTADLFREGVDKIIASDAASSSSSGGGGSGTTTDEKLQTIIDNQNRDSLMKYYTDSPYDPAPIIDSLTASSDLQAGLIVTALGNAGISRGAGVSAVGIGSTSEELAAFSVSGPFNALSAGFAPLAFTGPFAAFASFSAKFLDYAAVTREILLWLTIFGFWFFSRDLLERYLLSFQQTPQITTKVETAQITVPGVGLTKQLLTTLTIYSVMLLAIGGTIALMNTNLANIIPALTTSGITGLASHVYDSVGAAAGSPLMGFFERFVPLAAMLECAIAQIVLSWSMPIVWAACLVIARTFHL